MKIIGNGNAVIMLDDNPSDLTIARTCYEKAEIENPWVAFESAGALLAHLEEVTAGRVPLPALLFVDINMDEMSGFDVVRRIKEMPALAQGIPVVILTNSNASEDRSTATALDVQGFKVKPRDLVSYVAIFEEFA
jgi:CheY-like chemotaxis protein